MRPIPETTPAGEVRHCGEPVPVIAAVHGAQVHAVALAWADNAVHVELDPGTAYARTVWLPLASVRPRPAGESIVNRD